MSNRSIAVVATWAALIFGSVAAALGTAYMSERARNAELRNAALGPCFATELADRAALNKAVKNSDILVYNGTGETMTFTIEIGGKEVFAHNAIPKRSGYAAHIGPTQ